MRSLLRSGWAWTAVGVIALTLAGLWYFVWKSPLDRRTRDILAGADRVEGFRIDGGDVGREPQPPGESGLDGFRVIARGKEQGKEFTDRLAEILSDRKTHTSNWAMCYWPGVAFRVWKGDECVDVLICFKCDNFYCGPPRRIRSEERRVGQEWRSR